MKKTIIDCKHNARVELRQLDREGHMKSLLFPTLYMALLYAREAENNTDIMAIDIRDFKQRT